jgi:hypothetical protein
MGVYCFRQYRRTKLGSTTGELILRERIEAKNVAHAEQIAVRDFLPEVNFSTDFAILESDSGFLTCWLTGYEGT